MWDWEESREWVDLGCWTRRSLSEGGKGEGGSEPYRLDSKPVRFIVNKLSDCRTKKSELCSSGCLRSCLQGTDPV